MKCLFLLLLSFSGLTVFSQTPQTAIKFSPLCLLDDISFPTIQSGIEFRLSQKISWYNEIGIKYRNSYIENYVDTSFIKSEGFKLKTELKYHIDKLFGVEVDGYTGLNFFFTQDHHNTQIDYCHSYDTTIMTDDFGVKKNVLGCNLIIGKEMVLSKKLNIDLYAGLGIRYVYIATINEQYNKATDFIIRPIDVNIPSIRNQTDANAGNFIAPNLTLGIRICFKL